MLYSITYAGIEGEMKASITENNALIKDQPAESIITNESLRYDCIFIH